MSNKTISIQSVSEYLTALGDVIRENIGSSLVHGKGSAWKGVWPA